MPADDIERKLAAILHADIKGYSRLMGEDEVGTLQMLTAYREITDTLIHRHRGRIVGTAGDSILAEFVSAVAAVECAVEIQQAIETRNANLPSERRMEFRIGINVGDVIVEGPQIYGDGVNIAARVEALAEAGGICVSGTVYDQIENKMQLSYRYLGEQMVKNIAKPLRVYRVQREAETTAVPQGRGEGNPPLQPSTFPLPDKPSIIILPFINMSNDPDQEYFSDGITEDITTDLSRIASLFVISRNSAFTYKGKAVKVQNIMHEMGVRYVVEGSVRKVEERVRITVQLIDATTDHHLWAERYDRPLTDIFTVQDEIVQKIVTTLKLQLTLQEQGVIVHKRTDNLEAYDAFLRGMDYFWRLTREWNAAARQMWEKALALDPQYAEAYTWLAATYRTEWLFCWRADAQILEHAMTLARKALALDESLPIAHSLLSHVHANKQQYAQAIEEGERAILLDPNNADSHAFLTDILICAGRPEEALAALERAMRLNPRYPSFYLTSLGSIYRLTGRYAQAVTTLKEAISRSPNMIYAHLHLGFSYVQQWSAQQDPDGRNLGLALAAAQRVLDLNDSLYLTHKLLGYVFLFEKQYDLALAAMERAVTLAPTEAGTYSALADVLSRVGRTDEALEAAARALRLKSSLIVDEHLDGVASAYSVAGKPEEAFAHLKQCLTRYPDWLYIHLTLAAVYSELGKDAEARAEVAEVLRLHPEFSLGVHEDRDPIKDPAVLEHRIGMLRKAGLP